jgi:hypothetical protein
LAFKVKFISLIKESPFKGSQTQQKRAGLMKQMNRKEQGKLKKGKGKSIKLVL